MERRALVLQATDVLAKGFAQVATDRAAPDGRPTNALFGLIRGLRAALSLKRPDVAVAVIATEAPASWPEALREQHDRVRELLEAHGIEVVASEDPAQLAASAVRAGLEGGWDVVVVAGDKRFGQLVGDRVWWFEPYKFVRYTPDAVYKRFGVRPERVADWLALVGDQDAVEGVSGIGAKGAVDLLAAHGTLEAALADADAIEGRAGKALRAAIGEARRQLEVATLRQDLPVTLPPYADPDPERLNALYAELGFFEWLSAAGGEARTEVTVCADADAVRAAVDALAGEAALYAVIEDPSPPRGRLVGLAVSGGSGTAFYVPVAGKGPTVEPSVLAPWLGDPERPKVGHDVKTAVVAFARLGIPVRGVVGDSCLASHLKEPSSWAPHELDQIARIVLRRPVRDDTALRGKGNARKAWADLPVARTADLAGHLADTAGDLWRALAPETPRALLDEHLALCDTLVRMEQNGMPVDGADLERAGVDFDAIGADLERRIHELAGKEFNVNSTPQLGSVLFEDLKLPVVARTKTGWSVATEALERIEQAHPIVPLVIRFRLLKRMRDSWVTALQAAIDPDGRVRATFHPARSFTGRLVVSNPDLGRVPGRTPEMARIRRAFKAPPGWTLLSVDYVQLGLYVLAHLSRDPALVEPLRRQDDMHRLTASAVLDIPPEAVTYDQRQLGKVVNFATFAGQGASALALQLGVSAAEAKELIARFDARYSVVRAYQDEQLRLAQERGWIETIAGRRWPIGDLGSLDPMLRSAAERMARRGSTEGSVADVSRRSLLRADQALREAGSDAFPMVQVHDEVVFQVPKGELAAVAPLLAGTMRRAYDLVVPLRVGVEAGPNWADLEPLASE
jgi:DNA polymerase-1